MVFEKLLYFPQYPQPANIMRLTIYPFLLLWALLSDVAFSQSKHYTEWYLRTPDTLDVYHQDIYVRQLGVGKDTVIVIHGGFGANHDYMLDAISGLEKKYHFVLYDQRGSLMSPAPKEQLTFPKNVSDLHLLIKQLGCKKVKIMAHSMGTLVAMEYLRLHPETVSHLVLIGALYPKADSIESIFSKRYEEQVTFLSRRKEIEAIPIYQKYAAQKGEWTDDRERSDFNRLAFAASNIYKIERYRLIRGGFHYFKEEASAMLNTVQWKYDYRELLNNTNTTILFGDHDFIDFGGEVHQSLLRGYDRVQFRLVRQAGHNIWIDQPETFRKELDKALRLKKA